MRLRYWYPTHVKHKSHVTSLILIKSNVSIYQNVYLYIKYKNIIYLPMYIKYDRLKNKVVHVTCNLY